MVVSSFRKERILNAIKESEKKCERWLDEVENTAEETLKKLCDEAGVRYIGREERGRNEFEGSTTVWINVKEPKKAIKAIFEKEGDRINFVTFLGFVKCHPTCGRLRTLYEYARINVNGIVPIDYIIRVIH